MAMQWIGDMRPAQSRGVGFANVALNAMDRYEQKKLGQQLAAEQARKQEEALRLAEAQRQAKNIEMIETRYRGTPQYQDALARAVQDNPLGMEHYYPAQFGGLPATTEEQMKQRVAELNLSGIEKGWGDNPYDSSVAFQLRTGAAMPGEIQKDIGLRFGTGEQGFTQGEMIGSGQAESADKILEQREQTKRQQSVNATSRANALTAADTSRANAQLNADTNVLLRGGGGGPTGGPEVDAVTKRRINMFRGAFAGLEKVAEAQERYIKATQGGNPVTINRERVKYESIVNGSTALIGRAVGEDRFTEQDAKRYAKLLSPGIVWSAADPTLGREVLAQAKAMLESVYESSYGTPAGGSAGVGGAVSTGKTVSRAELQVMGSTEAEARAQGYTVVP